MKNTLAENLLRFGVKNLSESDRSKLAEQKPGAAATPAKTQTKRLAASFKTPYGGTGTFSATIQLDPTTKKWKVGQIRFDSEGGQDAGIKDIFTITGDGKGGGNFKHTESLIRQFQAKGVDSYSGPGLKPGTAAKKLAEQLSQATGAQWFASSELINLFSDWRNGYVEYKKSKVPAGTEQLKPGTEFGVVITRDPETNQILYRNLYYGPVTYNLQMPLDTNGTLSKVNARKFADKIKSNAPSLVVNAQDYWYKDMAEKDLARLDYKSLLQ
jgi:hypothetical protein